MQPTSRRHEARAAALQLCEAHMANAINLKRAMALQHSFCNSQGMPGATWKWHSARTPSIMLTVSFVILVLVQLTSCQQISTTQQQQQTFPPSAPYIASISYARNDVRQLAANASAMPYLIGGIDRPECKACRKNTYLAQLCTFKAKYNEANAKGPNICWASQSFSFPKMKEYLMAVHRRHVRDMPPGIPGPADFTPADLWAEFRSDTLHNHRDNYFLTGIF
jgi:hypothetical protein